MEIKNSAPCKGCKERYNGCHSVCLYYKNWKAEYEEKKKSLYGIVKKETILNSFAADSIIKARKANGKRGKKKIV